MPVVSWVILVVGVAVIIGAMLVRQRNKKKTDEKKSLPYIRVCNNACRQSLSYDSKCSSRR